MNQFTTKQLYIVIIAIILLMAVVVMVFADGEFIYTSEEDCYIVVPQGTYAIYSRTRKALMEYVEGVVSTSIEPLGCLIVIELEDMERKIDYYVEYEKAEDIPMGSVYCGNGCWLIYYENNAGYMDLWEGYEIIEKEKRLSYRNSRDYEQEVWNE